MWCFTDKQDDCFLQWEKSQILHDNFWWGTETGGGGFGPRALFLEFWTSSHGPDKDGSFFVLLHRNEWRWLILANRFTVYQTWCRCYQSSGNYDWIIFESEKIERLIKIKKNRDKKKMKSKVSKIPCSLDLFQSYKTNMLVVKLIVSYAEKLD